MKLEPTHDLGQNLDAARAAKAAVVLHLRSGASIAGKVAEVSDHFVLVTQLTGKEFFDALVRIDDISALETRARNA